MIVVKEKVLLVFSKGWYEEPCDDRCEGEGYISLCSLRAGMRNPVIIVVKEKVIFLCIL